MQNNSDNPKQSNSLNSYLESVEKYCNDPYFKAGNQMPSDAKESIARDIEKRIANYIEESLKEKPTSVVNIDFDFNRFGNQKQLIEGIFVNKLLQCQREYQEFNEILAQDPENTNKVVDLKIMVPKSANLSAESRKTLEDNNILSDHSSFIPNVPARNPEIIMNAESIPSPISSQFDKLPKFKNTLNSFPPKAQQFYSKVLEGYNPKLSVNNQANQNLKQEIELTIIKHLEMQMHSGFGLVEMQQNTASSSNPDNIKESDRYEKVFDILLQQNQQDPSRNNSFKILSEVKDFFKKRNDIYNDSVAKNFPKTQGSEDFLGRKFPFSGVNVKGFSGRGGGRG